MITWPGPSVGLLQVTLTLPASFNATTDTLPSVGGGTSVGEHSKVLIHKLTCLNMAHLKSTGLTLAQVACSTFEPFMDCINSDSCWRKLLLTEYNYIDKASSPIVVLGVEISSLHISPTMNHAACSTCTSMDSVDFHLFTGGSGRYWVCHYNQPGLFLHAHMPQSARFGHLNLSMVNILQYDKVTKQSVESLGNCLAVTDLNTYSVCVYPQHAFFPCTGLRPLP